MSLLMQVCCDVCGQQKREVNHWWVLQPSRLTGPRTATKWYRLSVMPWNDEDAASMEAQHICGQACMLKAMERFMQCHEVVRESLGNLDETRTENYPEEFATAGYQN
jgi:hypothetical protein